MSSSHQSRLRDDVLHGLGVGRDAGICKRPGGGDVYISTNQEELKHVVIELGLTLVGFVRPQFNNNSLCLVGRTHISHICTQLLQKHHWD
jgi:hypothetical protein